MCFRRASCLQNAVDRLAQRLWSSTAADCLSDAAPSTYRSPSFPRAVAGSSGIPVRKQIHIGKAQAPSKIKEGRDCKSGRSARRGIHAQPGPRTDLSFPASSSLHPLEPCPLYHRQVPSLSTRAVGDSIESPSALFSLISRAVRGEPVPAVSEARFPCPARPRRPPAPFPMAPKSGAKTTALRLWCDILGAFEERRPCLRPWLTGR